MRTRASLRPAYGTLISTHVDGEEIVGVVLRSGYITPYAMPWPLYVVLLLLPDGHQKWAQSRYCYELTGDDWDTVWETVNRDDAPAPARPARPARPNRMLYLATPSGHDARVAMSLGLLGCMTTPAQGNRIPDGAWYACDNGKFGKGWPGADEWFTWLARQVERYGADRCLWAVAPDVPFDAAATLAESRPWLARIRALGIPAAYAAQDGSENGLIPWDEIDVLFLAGSTEWKIGAAAERLSREAAARGIPVHMGRVNSRKRLRIAEHFGCATADGTYVAFGPGTNLPKLLGWMDELHTAPSLFAQAV